MRSIAIREELTEEWKNHVVKEQVEYAILTSEISKATFVSHLNGDQSIEQVRSRK